jgi:tetratricopeptide (TPR) repeat protein
MPRAAWLLAAALLSLYLAFGAFQVYDFDLPLHLVTGEHLIKDPATADVEIFSFTFPGYHWLNDKWLENVLVYGVDAAGGPAGLVAFRMLLVAGLGWLLWSAMGAGETAPPPASAIALRGALLTLFPFVAYERFPLRPELFSLVLLAIVLRRVARDRRTRGDGIAIGLFHVLWVNLHGYWILGPLVIVAFLAGDLMESFTARLGWPRDLDADAAPRRARHRGGLLLAALGGALVSPHPLGLFLNPLVVLRVVGAKEGGIESIAEMRSPFDESGVFNLAIGFFYALIPLVAVALLARPRRVRPAHLLLAAGFFAMAATSRRNIGIFAIVGIVLIAWSLRGAASRGGRPAAPRPGLRRAALAAVVLLVGVDVYATAFVLTDRFYIADGTSRRTGFTMSSYTYPQGLASFILTNNLPGKFFNDFASGSYLAYRLYPEHRVFITGNTFKYPPEFFDEYTLTSLGGDAYQEVWRKYGLDAFAIMYTSADMMPLARRLFNDPEWVPVHFDDNSLLFVRDIESMRPLIAAHRVDFAALARERSQTAPPATWSGAAWLPLERRIFPRGELNRAMFLHRVGLFPMAEVEYRRALRVDPTVDAAHHGLGDVLLGQSRFDEAAASLEPLLAREPDDPHLLRDLAEARSGIGSAAAARQDWTVARREIEVGLERLLRAREVDPEGERKQTLEATDRFNLGFVLWQMSQAPGAEAGLAARSEQEFATLLADLPPDASTLYRLARVRMRQGRRPEALALLERGLPGADAGLRGQAMADPAFAELAAEPRFRALVAAGASAGAPAP